MKVNIWRIVVIVLACVLASLIWYLSDLDERAKSHINQLKNEVAFLTGKITVFSTLKKTLQTMLTTYKEENETLLAKINDYESSIGKLSYEMEKVTSDLLSTEKAAFDKGTEIDELKKKIEEYKTENIRLKEKLSLISGKPWHKETAPSDITLAPITIKPGNLKVKGRVLEVNRRYDFIVVSVGKRKGLREGDVLYIFRGRKMLAQVVAERVGSDAAITRALHRSLANVNIKRGDKVRF